MKVSSYSFTLLILIIFSCNSWQVPEAYTGQWVTAKSKVTVRTESEKMKFHFTRDSIQISIRINGDKTVTGTIGAANIKNGRLKKNRGLPPSITGISYIISFDPLSKLFPGDPMNEKMMEIWLRPIENGGYLEAELRQKDHADAFPMAGLTFIREKDSIH
ncbi:MAG: hypothetical protein IPH45_19700 [Bacteroidales bacterium]|nr:hypothetical protein [Bacteroidales bacterium]